MYRKSTYTYKQYTMTDDKKTLMALACSATKFSRSDINLISSEVMNKYVRNSAPFLKKYKDIIKEAGTIGNVACYMIEYEGWKSLLNEIGKDEIDDVCKLSMKLGKEGSVLFCKMFWHFMHKVTIPQEIIDKAIECGYISITEVVSSYVSDMVYEKAYAPFLSVTNGYLIQLALREMEYALDQQMFTDKNIEAFNALLDMFKEGSDKAMASILKAKIGFAYHFVRKLDLPSAYSLASEDASGRYACFYAAFKLLQEKKFEDAAKLMLRHLKTEKSQAFMDTIIDFYFALALTHSNQPSALTRCNVLLRNEDIASSAKLVLSLENGRFKARNLKWKSFWEDKKSKNDEVLLLLLFKHYGMTDGAQEDALYFANQFVDGKDIQLLQMELSCYIQQFKSEAQKIFDRTGFHATLAEQKKMEEWEEVLNDLLQINDSPVGGKKKSSGNSMQRIVYELNTRNMNIQPRLQKSKDGVTWTGGRNISLEKFSKGTADGMTDADHKIASCVECYSYGWYGQTSYELAGNKAVAALVGNPNVYDANTEQHLDVVEEKLGISVKEKDGCYHISTDVDFSAQGGVYVTKESAQKVKVVMISPQQKKTLELMQKTPFPQKAKDKLTKVLELVSTDMVVMSDLLKASDNIANKRAHSEIVVQLQPQIDTIGCQIFVRPFGSMPPVCKPGKGMQTITTSIDGKQVQTKRNLKKENENCQAVEALMVDYESTGNYAWSLTPEECLLLLEQLHTMEDTCTIEWPEGEQLKVVRPQLTPADFNISVGSLAGWFEISGDVQIDEKKKMKIAELVEHINNSKGNFISLGGNDYVRITAQLRKYIDGLSRITSASKGKLRLSPFNVFMLKELENSGVQLKYDKAYKNMIERIEEADHTEVKVPRNINADLRDYQKEGYRWMARLAAWGAGALLADDMGLGKTLQTITLLLSRAKEGPQLVVVPTSLIINWRDEIARFAPSLNVQLLNKQGDSRASTVKEAKDFDIIITTYGILVTEEELLTSREWNTIVLDEAHTIKNRDTKMSKAAMKLQTKCRILLTGTPLQNHLSEIWNLMQFANPSLLGSYQEFTDRFILPIERDHNKERQQLLRRIISPFILRRTKSEVLNELPEKTEITLKVDLSSDEWAFYDNIRQQAVAAMENTESTALQALAEITRLRQAACNVQLVEKKLKIASSKLEAFMQLVSELHDNHHRALVFSQFTSHLALIRQRLDAEGIEYLYLDGSTTAKERINLVDKFQHGDMPLFLISLKAGGLGLNLTAADYIIHLDPWWNPAIEDQASDRAYRIGQQNPVTVYRLIAAGTIEEKIISLHQTKKNLADALLEGSDMSATMTREEMLALLREAM